MHRLRDAPLIAVLLAAAACRLGEERGAARAPQPSPPLAAVPGEPVIVSAGVPIEGFLAVDAQQLEAERLDAAWRAEADRDRLLREQGLWPPPTALASTAVPSGTTASAAGTPSAAVPTPRGVLAPVERMRSMAATAAAESPGTTPVASPDLPRAPVSASTGPESWEGITAEAFASFEPRFPISRAGGGPTVLAVQQMLDRVLFSPGVIDGRWGKNTEKAVYWLQDSLGLEPTGTVDADLFARLHEAAGTASPLRRYTIAAADLAGPFIDIPADYVEQATLDCLCYGSAVEELAERFHITRDLLAKLNPNADLGSLTAGSELWVLDVDPLDAAAGSQAAATASASGTSPIAELVISKDGFYLQALDAAKKVLFHFPTTVGAGYDASPTGELAVTATAFNPTFHYQPKLFADVDDAKPEAMLPAGPNSPVGVVWMQLSKDNFGIHGTAEPANIGYRTSHGCVRLTNWDALFLARRVPKGTPVYFRGLDTAATAAR